MQNELTKLIELQKLLKEREELVNSENESVIDQREKEIQLKNREKETGTETAARYAGHAARTAVGGLGDLADLPSMPANLGRYIRGSQIPEGYGSIARKKFDAITNKKYRPLTESGELADTIVSALVGTKGLGSIGKLLTQFPTIDKLGKFLKNTNTLNTKTVVGTAAGVGTTHELIKKNPEHPYAAIIAGILAGHYGSKVPGAIGKLPGAVKKGRIHAAIRNPNYGKEIEEALPHYYGLGDESHSSYDKVGELAKKAADSLESKKSEYFSKLKKSIKDDFDDAAGAPGTGVKSADNQRMVDVSPVADFIANKYHNDYSHSKSTQNIFFKGPLAKQFANILGVKPDALNPTVMRMIKEQGLPPGYALHDIESVYTLRKELDSIIKSKEFNHIGGDKNALTKVRGLLESIREQGFENVSPDLAARLKSYKSDYKNYIENDAQYLNKIRDEGASSHGQYKKSHGDLYEGGKDIGYTLNELNPEESSVYLKRLFRDMGKVSGKNVSSNTLTDKFYSLEPEVQKRIFDALPETDKSMVKDLLASQKGYKKIIGEDVNAADIGMRAHALGKKASWMSSKARKVLTHGLDTPEGKKKAMEVILEEGKNINPNPAHAISPKDAPREGVKYIPNFITNLPKTVAKTPGLAQQLSTVMKLYGRS